MYTEFYGLEKKPFNMTPDPAFLFLTEQHREALAGLSYAILERKGFLVLSGTAGTGKTTLLAWVLQKLPSERVQSSVILNPTLTPAEFLELAMLDFDISDIPESKAQRLWKLQKFLLRGRQEGKINVLIIDEAHKLTTEVLEEIRLLGNFEYGDEKLLQVLLLGQKELDDVLNRPNLWQLKQRISVRLSLEALSESEVERYIQYRWCVAGGKKPAPFSSGAIAGIAKCSQGIPRLINSICDNALMLAFAEEAPSVSAEHVESSAMDLQLIEKPAPKLSPASPSWSPPPPLPSPQAMPKASAVRPNVPAVMPTPVLKTIARYNPDPAAPPILMRWAQRLLGRRNGSKPV